jgi:hypothetical protein
LFPFNHPNVYDAATILPYDEVAGAPAPLVVDDIGYATPQT